MLTEIQKHYHLMQEINTDQTIFSIIRHVSQSGMTRHIAFFYINNNAPYWITYDIHKMLGYKMNKYHDALVVGGCGMDMAWSVVNNLEGKINEDYKQEFPNAEPNPFKLKSRIL